MKIKENQKFLGLDATNMIIHNDKLERKEDKTDSLEPVMPLFPYNDENSVLGKSPELLKYLSLNIKFKENRRGGAQSGLLDLDTDWILQFIQQSKDQKLTVNKIREAFFNFTCGKKLRGYRDRYYVRRTSLCLKNLYYDKKITFDPLPPTDKEKIIKLACETSVYPLQEELDEIAPTPTTSSETIDIERHQLEADSPLFPYNDEDSVLKKLSEQAETLRTCLCCKDTELVNSVLDKTNDYIQWLDKAMPQPCADILFWKKLVVHLHYKIKNQLILKTSKPANSSFLDFIPESKDTKPLFLIPVEYRGGIYEREFFTIYYPKLKVNLDTEESKRQNKALEKDPGLLHNRIIPILEMAFFIKKNNEVRVNQLLDFDIGCQFLYIQLILNMVEKSNSQLIKEAFARKKRDYHKRYQVYSTLNDIKAQNEAGKRALSDLLACVDEFTGTEQKMISSILGESLKFEEKIIDRNRKSIVAKKKKRVTQSDLDTNWILEFIQQSKDQKLTVEKIQKAFIDFKYGDKADQYQGINVTANASSYLKNLYYAKKITFDPLPTVKPGKKIRFKGEISVYLVPTPTTSSKTVGIKRHRLEAESPLLKLSLLTTNKKKIKLVSQLSRENYEEFLLAVKKDLYMATQQLLKKKKSKHGNCILLCTALLSYAKNGELPKKYDVERSARLSDYAVRCSIRPLPKVKGEETELEQITDSTVVERNSVLTQAIGDYCRELPSSERGKDSKEILNPEKTQIYIDQPLTLFPQQRQHFSELSDNLKKRAREMDTQFFITMVNFARCGKFVNEPGHAILALATPWKVCYFDPQSYSPTDPTEGFSDDLESFDFAEFRGKKPISCNTFGNIVFTDDSIRNSWKNVPLPTVQVEETTVVKVEPDGSSSPTASPCH